MAQLARVVVTEDNFDAFDRKLRLGVTQEVHRAANATRNRARQIIVRDDAIITGDLWRSIGVAEGPTGAEVYSSVDYASFVHDGTEHMAARPFFTEAIADVLVETQRRLARILDGTAK